MENLNFLHLSDLHFNSNSIHDTKIILDELIKDIERMQNSLGKLDFIIFSGDLVQKGESQPDFEKSLKYFFEPLLNVSKLTFDEIFIVPGNHDIEINKINTIFESSFDDALNCREKLNEFIDKLNEPINLNLLDRLTNYNKISNDYGAKYLKSKNPLYKSFIFPKNGKKIGIACLNSSWRASGKKNNYDYGKLLIGERQLDLATKDLTECDFKIAIFHHPWDWLNPFDSKDIKMRLIFDYNMLCVGHSHNPSFEVIDIVENKLILTYAGCLYKERKFYNGYTFSSIDFTLNEITIQLRSYFDERRVFDKGINKISDGEKKFPIFDFSQKRKISLSINELDKMSKGINTIINKQLVSSTGDSFAPKDLKKIFVPPKLLSISDSKREINEEFEIEKKEISVNEILNSSKNYLIWGKKESGKTTLLNYLGNCMLDKDNLESIKIPIYIDFQKIVDSKKELFKSIKNYLSSIDYDLKKFELETKLNEGNFLICFDNVYLDENRIPKQACIIDFISNYKNNKFVLTTTENNCNTIEINEIYEKETVFSIDFENIYISSFDRNQTRQLVAKWFYQHKHADIETILNTLLKYISKTNIPRTPIVISLMLWIYEKQQDFIPINKASLVEKFIEVLLEKMNWNESSYKNFDYKDKEHYLAYIAKKMVDDKQYAYERYRLEAITLEYLSKIRGLKFDSVTDFINYYIYKGIFIEIENTITFKYKCFCEYFIAKRMMIENDFYNRILDEKHYLNYINEIDYLSGLQRNNKDLLKILLERLEKTFNSININIPLELFSDINLRYSAIKRKLENKTPNQLKDELTENRMDDITRDNILNASDPEVVKNGKQIERDFDNNDKVEGLLFIQSLSIFSKVTRNSDQIEDLELWSKCLRTAIFYSAKVIVFFLTFIQFIFDNSKKSKSFKSFSDEDKIFIDQTEAILKIYFFWVFSDYIYEDLGTKKIEILIDDILKREDLNLIEELLYVLLFSELKFSDYTQKIEKLLDNENVNDFVLEFIFFKINYYCKFQKLSRDEMKHLESLFIRIIAEINEGNLKKKNLKMIKANCEKYFKNLKKNRIETIIIKE